MKFKMVMSIFFMVNLSALRSFSNEKKLWEAAKDNQIEQVKKIMLFNPKLNLFWRPDFLSYSTMDYLQKVKFTLNNNFDIPYNDESKLNKIDIIKNPHKYFFIAPSSIPGNSNGFGLYVKKELPGGLKSLPAGLTLPFLYPGKSIDFSQYNLINDFLLNLANKYEKNNLPINDKSIESHLVELKNFGINIYLEVKDPNTLKWTNLTTNKDKVKINWNKLYDQFIDYSFECKDKKNRNKMLFIKDYTHDGLVRFDNFDLQNMLYNVNEPPTHNFINLYTMKLQTNHISLAIIPMESKSNLTYRLIKPVEAGEELFLTYGPDYEKNRERTGYKINLSRENGGGMYDLVDSYFDEEFEITQYNNSATLTPYKDKNEDIKYYQELIQYFNKIVNYQQDSRIKISNLDNILMNWFTQNVDVNFAFNYVEAVNQLKILQNDEIRGKFLEERNHEEKREYSEDAHDYWHGYMLGLYKKEDDFQKYTRMLKKIKTKQENGVN